MNRRPLRPEAEYPFARLKSIAALVVFAATYGSVSAAQTDLDAIEALHKDKVIGSFDAAVIDQEDGKPHVVKRMDRPGVRVIPGGSAAEPAGNSPPARQG